MTTETEKKSTSYLFGSNAPYVEELYEEYLANPAAVGDHWRNYFDQLQHTPATDGSERTRDQNHHSVVTSFAQRAKANAFAQAARATAPSLEVASKQLHVQSLIAAYRTLGVRWAELDPLKRRERPEIPELDPAFYGLTEADLDQVYSATNTYFTKQGTMTLREILNSLRDTYCGAVGVEFMHMSDPKAKRWVQEHLESTHANGSFDSGTKKRILQQLTEAEGLERFLHTKY
ncbi:MAG: 2-oxoglutarate dehydrogenase E1 subunit family protein, partial [Advenella sp.]